MTPLKKNDEKCKNCGFKISDYSAPPRSLIPGTVINDRYLAGIAVSEDSYSVTYAGMDLTEKKKTFIKEYFPSSCCSRVNNESENKTVKIADDKKELFESGKNDFMSRFKTLRETGKTSPLKGISLIADVFEWGGTCYAVSGFVSGTPLEKTAADPKKKFPADEFLTLMKPVIDSMITLHSQGIFHGNISPANIIIADDKKSACLVDFGIYGINDNAFKFSLAPKAGFTPIEEYPDFKEEIGGWTDIFGICSSIYFGITGIVPGSAPDRANSDNLKTLSELGVKLSETKEAALMQGLAVYRKDRFKAVRALYNALFSEDGEKAETDSSLGADISEASKANDELSAGKSEPKKGIRHGVKKVKLSMKEEDIAPWAGISVKKEPEPKPEPKPETKPEPKQEPKTAPAPAPTYDSQGAYSQVIVKRKSKDNIEIGGIKLTKRTDKLDLTSKGITDDDTDILSELTELEYLTVNDNKIADIEFVSSLKKLVLFSASNNYITDISPLINLGQLTELDLSGNKELEDISVLEYLRGIRKLDLSNTAIKSVAPLIYLDHLKSLNLKGTQITERQIKSLYAEMPTCSIKYDVKKK